MATNTQDPVNTLGYIIVSKDEPTTQVLDQLEFSDLPYGSIKTQTGQPLNITFGANAGAAAYTIDDNGFTIKNPSLVGYVPVPLVCYEKFDTTVQFPHILSKTGATLSVNITLQRFQDIVMLHIPGLDGIISTAQTTYTSTPALPARFWAAPTNPTNGQRFVVSMRSLNQVTVLLDVLDNGFIAITRLDESAGPTTFPSSDISSKGILVAYRLAALS